MLEVAKNSLDWYYLDIMNKEQEQQIDEVLTRGVEQVLPSSEELKKVLMSGKKIKLYCGFDPSASALHIGNAIALNKLSQFQKLGHKIIFLIGDFTGMIGDPTDKTAARKKMTREEVLANAKDYVAQASYYLDFSGENPAEVKYNSEWNDKLTFKELIELSSNFTVQQMMQRDMFQERIKSEQPIYLHEFFYPLTQAYDSVVLDVDLEVGGNDQMFNMKCGRELMKAFKNKEKFVLMTKLIADDSGKKMGKSEGNVVFLNENPTNMFGKIMAWPDGVLNVAFELCTKVPMERILEIREELKDPKTNPRDLKLELAFEITKIVHGEAEAQKAKEYFVNTFSKKEMPTEIREVRVEKENTKILDYIVAVGFATSKGDARRKLEQGGVSIDGEKISEDIVLDEKYTGKVLKVGKKDFVKIKF